MIEELRAAIVAQYGSIYRFCKLNPKVKKATAYLVLNGKYPGKILKQAQVLQDILYGTDTANIAQSVEQDEILQVLQRHKCSYCRLISKNCTDCKQKTAGEAQAVYQYVCAKL